MNVSTWGPIDWIITAIPFVFIVAAVRIGSLQVREFRGRSGDHGLFTALMGFAGIARRGRVAAHKPAHKPATSRKRSKRSASPRTPTATNILPSPPSDGSTLRQRAPPPILAVVKPNQGAASLGVGVRAEPQYPQT